MHFELIPKTRIKVLGVVPQALKRGQKDLTPAVRLRLRATVPNDKLSMFSPNLRDFLFERNSAAQTQGVIEGVQVVSEYPQLTEPAKRMGSLHWEAEQGGCKLKLYQGVTGDMNITLQGCTLSKFKLTGREGGTTDIEFNVYASDLDAETLGELGVLVKHEVDVEIIAPDVMQQGTVLSDEEEDEPLTPEQALADSMAEAGTAAEGRTAKHQARKVPLAKKIARSSRKAQAH